MAVESSEVEMPPPPPLVQSSEVEMPPPPPLAQSSEVEMPPQPPLVDAVMFLPSMVANYVPIVPVPVVAVPSSPTQSKHTRGAAVRHRYSPRKIMEVIDAAVSNEPVW